MIQDAEKGLFDRIIFIKLDRFFRSVAEYHECMKRIAPVIWTATEEKYDLSTAQGRMLVNFKLTIAEMEADTGSERVHIVNDYKLSTGQPLSGSMPLGFKIETEPSTGRKKIIRDTDVEHVIYDMIDFCLKHQSKRKTVLYLKNKHHISISYNSLSRLLANTMLYGCYRDNPNYCEAYMDKSTFDRLQEVTTRNVKDNTAENRAYYFSGLIVCPECGNRLAGLRTTAKKNGHVYHYKKYRCFNYYINKRCSFNKVVSERVLERMLLANIAQYLDDAKMRVVKVTDGESTKIPAYDIEDLHEQLDRLNYSWQTGKIRKVAQYEKQYSELIEKIEKAEAEQQQPELKDFSHIEELLQGGWKEIYSALDDAYKRAFWRSFIQSIEIDWTTESKKIKRVNFF